MNDMIPADKVRDLRDQYARLIEDAGTKETQAYYGHVVKDLDALLPAPPLPTLTEGSEWGDIDALTTACRESGRDQITVIDCDGDVSVWSADAEWWETGTPSDGYEPYTILHTGKEADQ